MIMVPPSGLGTCSKPSPMRSNSLAGSAVTRIFSCTFLGASGITIVLNKNDTADGRPTITIVPSDWGYISSILPTFLCVRSFLNRAFDKYLCCDGDNSRGQRLPSR